MNLSIPYYPGTAHSKRVASFLYAWCEVHPDRLRSISRRLGLTFLNEGAAGGNLCYANIPGVRPEFKTVFYPEDLFHYYYGLMHAAPFRAQYGDFRFSHRDLVPLPAGPGLFWEVAAIGKALNKTHTGRLDPANSPGVRLSGKGKERVQAPYFDTGSPAKLYINSTRYFAPVSPWAWNFQLGPYRPVPHWLGAHEGQVLAEAKKAALTHLVRVIETSRDLITELEHLLQKQLPGQGFPDGR